MGIIEFYKSIYKFSSIKVKVALFEALVVTISSCVALVPWNKTSISWNDVTLIFTPILVLMVANNVSSFTNIHLSITMLLGTLIGSLYVYVILILVKQNVWISFITTFVVFYIVASLSNIPNRKWMTGLFQKKMFLDIFITIYFTKYDLFQHDIIENIYSILFVMASIVIGSLVFPTLASRLIYHKVVKTMVTTRLYFLLLGSQFEEKVYTLNNKNKLELDSNNSIVKRKQTYVQTFENIENQLIREQQIKYSTLNNSNIKPVPLSANISMSSSSVSLSTSSSSASSNSSLLPLSAASSLPSNKTPLLNWPTNIDQFAQEDKLKLPLSRSRINETSSISIDIGNHRVNSSSSSKKQINISSPMPELEDELSNRICTMGSLYMESKTERWNRDLNDNYNILISRFEQTLKQLISINNSIKSGFSVISSDELIAPLVPFIECLVEEVYLQMGIMIEILKSKQTNESDLILLSKSFDETQELVNRVKAAFRVVVDEYQRGGHPLLVDEEVTKVHFFVHGILSFAIQQREFSNLLIKVKQQQRECSERWELIRYGFLYCITGFPMLLLKRYRFLKQVFNSSSSSSSSTSISRLKKENNFILLIGWIRFHFFKNGKWRNPLQIAFAMMTSIIPFYYYDGQTDSSGLFVVNGVWTVTTIIFVNGNTLGASITKGFEESKGTIAGAIIGYCVSLLCSVLPTPWREIVIAISIFIFVFLISFPHQHAPNVQAAEICGLTFLLIVLGQNLTKDYNYMFAILRALHIFMGVFWNVLCCLVVFPFFTYKYTRLQIFKVTNLLSETFINIIEYGLRMNESIGGTPNQELLLLFNSDASDIQQSKEIIERRHNAIINILMNHKDDLMNDIKNNNVNNINSIIKFKNNNSIESIRSERMRKKKQIFESLIEIRTGIEEILGSLADVKSELYFASPSKSPKYYSIADSLVECSTCLIALENSFDPIFSDILILSMYDLISPLNSLFAQLIKSKSDIKLLMASKLQDDNQVFQHCTLIQEKWDQVMQQFISNRLFLLNQKLFHILHPEQIQFGSGIHSIKTFIEIFIKLLNDERFIKEESSYLKQLLKLK